MSDWLESDAEVGPANSYASGCSEKVGTGAELFLILIFISWGVV